MPSHRWLACRVALALALMAGFYALALAVAFGLLWIAYADVTYTNHANARIVIFCVLGAFSVLWSIIPRPDRFEPPGPRVDALREPALFAAISEIAAATGQAMPADVYLVNDVNAFVTQRGGIMGFGSHRVMGLGLPLMHAVTVQEFKAILAHEFGHYHSGDVALGPWIYKTRAAIGRTIQRLSSKTLQKIFIAYGTLFLRVTHAVSRRQEFIADEVAAHAAGADAMKSGLRKVHAATLAFHAYWFSEIGPVFQSGFLPPVNAGFSRFLESGRILSQLDSAVSHEEAQGQTRPYDTHPSLRDRIAALGVHPAGPGGDSRRAASLLANIPQREREVLEFVSRDLASLTRVEWEHVIDSVYVPLWRQRLAQHGYLLTAITVGAIPASRTDFVRLGSPLFTTDQSPSEDERVGRMGQLVVAAIALRLLSVGWKAETSPGDEIVLLHDGLELRPSSELSAILEGRATRDEWRARCLTMGIADLPLIAGGDPQAAQTGAAPAAGH